MLKYYLIKVYYRINYSIKQHIAIYIGEVLPRSGRGILTGSWL